MDRRASFEAKDGWGLPQTSHTVCLLCAECLPATHRNNSRTPLTRGSERSLLSLHAVLTQPLIERSVVASLDFPIDLLKEVSAASAGRKILLHLAIPGLFFELVEPLGKLLTFGFGEMNDGFLDGFHGHTPNIGVFQPFRKFALYDLKPCRTRSGPPSVYRKIPVDQRGRGEVRANLSGAWVKRGASLRHAARVECQPFAALPEPETEFDRSLVWSRKQASDGILPQGGILAIRQ
jgi:hypothetical protein